MAKRFQLRRGNTSETNAFTGALGEVTVDTDKDVVVVHDGATVGGHPTAARANTNGSISFIARDGTVRGSLGSNNDAAFQFLSVTGGSAGVGTVASGFGLARIAIGDNDTGIAQNGDGVLQLWSNNVPTFQTGGGSDLFQARSVDALRPAFFVRAWVNFNGTTTPPSVRGSGNVSSVVRNATGDYTVTFTTAMPDPNYSVSGSLKTQDNNIGANNQAVLNPYNFTSSSFRFIANDGGALRDAIHCNITVTR